MGEIGECGAVSELYIRNTTIIMCKCSSILESDCVTSTISVDLPTFLQKSWKGS